MKTQFKSLLILLALAAGLSLSGAPALADVPMVDIEGVKPETVAQWLVRNYTGGSSGFVPTSQTSSSITFETPENRNVHGIPVLSRVVFSYFPSGTSTVKVIERSYAIANPGKINEQAFDLTEREDIKPQLEALLQAIKKELAFRDALPPMPQSEGQRYL